MLIFKKAIVLTTMTMLFTIPVYGVNETDHQSFQSKADFESEIADTKIEKLLDGFEKSLIKTPDSTMKYTTTAVNIQKLPSDDSEIIGQRLPNTQVEVVAEMNGWAMITEKDGYAYMRTDWFSDAPIAEKNYTDEDLRILAMILCGECHSYPDEEQRLVGSVFLNRVKSDQFPNTFQGVAADRRYGIQYACWYDGNAFREIQQSNWDNAKWLLENGSILPDGVLYQSGRRTGKVYMKTKWHYYCY